MKRRHAGATVCALLWVACGLTPTCQADIVNSTMPHAITAAEKKVLDQKIGELAKTANLDVNATKISSVFTNAFDKTTLTTAVLHSMPAQTNHVCMVHAYEIAVTHAGKSYTSTMTKKGFEAWQPDQQSCGSSSDVVAILFDEGVPAEQAADIVTNAVRYAALARQLLTSHQNETCKHVPFGDRAFRLFAVQSTETMDGVDLLFSPYTIVGRFRNSGHELTPVSVRCEPGI